MSYKGVAVIFYYVDNSDKYKILIGNESTYLIEVKTTDNNQIEKCEEILFTDSSYNTHEKRSEEFAKRARKFEEDYKVHIKYDNILKSISKTKENKGKDIHHVNFRIKNDKLGVVKGNIEEEDKTKEGNPLINAAIRETWEEIHLVINKNDLMDIGNINMFGLSKVFMYNTKIEETIDNNNSHGELFDVRYEYLDDCLKEDNFKNFNRKSQDAIKMFKKYITPQQPTNNNNNSNPSDGKWKRNIQQSTNNNKNNLKPSDGNWKRNTQQSTNNNKNNSSDDNWRTKKNGGTRKKGTRKNRGKGSRKSRRGHRTYKRKH